MDTGSARATIAALRATLLDWRGKVVGEAAPGESAAGPVLVVTVTNREQKARALGADEFWLKPIEQSWLLRKLRALAHTTPVERILVIDDDLGRSAASARPG